MEQWINRHFFYIIVKFQITNGEVSVDNIVDFTESFEHNSTIKQFFKDAATECAQITDSDRYAFEHVIFTQMSVADQKSILLAAVKWGHKYQTV